jgi:hypothetical protein
VEVNSKHLKGDDSDRPIWTLVCHFDICKSEAELRLKVASPACESSSQRNPRRFEGAMVGSDVGQE